MFHATVWIKRQRVVWYPKLLNHVSPHEYQFLAGESECEDVLWSWLWAFILVFKSSSGSVWSAANVFQFRCQSKRVASWITEQLLSLIIIRTCDRGVGLDPSPGSWATLLCPPGGATTTENTAQSVSVAEMWACQMFSCHRNTNRKCQVQGPPAWFCGYSLTDPSTLTNHKYDICSQTAHSLLSEWIRRRGHEPKTPQILLWSHWEPSGPT